jgi:hypothetical protein
MRHHYLRRNHMLQWNTKRTALLVVVLLIAFAAVAGSFEWDAQVRNITW